jgi:hypothetical protein
MFLHVKAERHAEVYSTLQERLAGISDVLMVDDALEAGLFGEAPAGQELRRRLGDILVLPHAGHFVWWREPGIVENVFHGHHGGLTAEELLTVAGVLGG